MKKQRTGTLEFKSGRWQARLTVVVDGVRKRPWWDTCVTDPSPLGKATARRKLASELAKREASAEPMPADALAGPETLESFGEGWLKSREARGVASASHERTLFEHVWKPRLGMLPLGAVTAAQVRAVLDECASGTILPKPRKHVKTPPKPYGQESLGHIRAVLFRLLDAAWRDELIPNNPVEKVRVPEIEETKKARAVLTDDEFSQLLAHPEVDAEIKLLVLLSRTIGGLRAGDLNTLDWTAFSPDFATCTVVRRKTRKKRPLPVTFAVPEPVRPFLDAWWRRQECPEAGPVFPVRKGARAGKEKKASNMSYADRLRRELITAGITRHELHNETATTRPVDFHSTRRAYASALARIGVNEQTAMALTGHADSKVHRRYLEQQSIKELPAAAVPVVDPKAIGAILAPARKQHRPSAGTITLEGDSRTGLFSGAGHEARTRDPELGKQSPGAQSSGIVEESFHGDEPVQPGETGWNGRRGQLRRDSGEPSAHREPGSLAGSSGSRARWSKQAADAAIGAHLGAMARHIAAELAARRVN